MSGSVFLLSESSLVFTALEALEDALKDVGGELADASIRPIGPTVDDAARALAGHVRAAPRLIVVDGRLPKDRSSSVSMDGTPAFNLLKNLREHGNEVPILSLIYAGMSKLERWCTPSNRAIAIPIERLDDPAVLAKCIRMLPPQQQAAWDVIELEVANRSVKCYLGSSAVAASNKTLLWSEASLPTPLRSLADKFRDLKRKEQKLRQRFFSSDWLQGLHYEGRRLFRDIVQNAFGVGFFAHIEAAAGGLANLKFRFRVTDPALHDAPFEATVRVSDDEEVDESDLTRNPFVLAHAPIARNMKVVNVSRRLSDDQKSAHRMLFVRSQLGTPENEKIRAVLRIEERDATGEPGSNYYEFERLPGIDAELSALKDLSFDLDENVLDLEMESSGAADALRARLRSGCYDIVHFAGHSLTTSDGQTFLILPGTRPTDAVAMTTDDFARCACSARARLVYHSSCSGGSAQAVVHLAQYGVPHVLGFRWDVNDEEAAEFARGFYTTLNRPPHTICSALRTVCGDLFDRFKGQKPIWASPIFVAQSEDWTRIRVFSSVDGGVS
jgi:CHAT domain